METGRLTEVWVPGLRRVGSGYLLADRLVLTSWHVVAGIGARDRVEVRPLEGRGHTAWLAASLCWPSAPANIKTTPEQDAALLVINDPDWRPVRPAEAVRFGEVSGQDRIACKGVGFPDAEARPDGRRDTMPVRGHLDPLQALKSGMLSVHVDEGIVPRRLESGSGWAGSSGTALFCGPLLTALLVTDRGIAADASVLGAVPLSALAGLPGFRDTLRAHNIELRFEDAADHVRSEVLRDYLTAAGRAAREQPYPGIVPGRITPLAAVYLRQQVRQSTVKPGHEAAGNTALPQDVLRSTDEVLALPGTCIVAGGAGSGKSSLLRAWTAELTDRLLNDLPRDGTTVPVPVLVQATAVAKGLRAEQLPDALAAAASAVARVHGLLPAGARDGRAPPRSPDAQRGLAGADRRTRRGPRHL